jgi:predicted metal-dependent HD superfamily phosphohydrolase
MRELADRWPLTGYDEVRAGLVAAYADPARDYHDLRHLEEVLVHVDELLACGEPANRDAVLLAAWFHDAVYHGDGQDEERSAVLAEEQLAGHPLAAEVARLVRLTATHRPEDDDSEGQVLCDADLAILAAGPQRYREYVDGVRREHAHVSEADFVAGRAAVLRDLLAKPTLFHTRAGREHFEERARANVADELEQLAS